MARAEEKTLTKAEKAQLLEEKLWAQRLLGNEDFVRLLTKLELNVGGLNYTTAEVDLFTQGRVSLLNDIKLLLVSADNACETFAKLTSGFYARLHERKAAQLKKETK